MHTSRRCTASILVAAVLPLVFAQAAAAAVTYKVQGVIKYVDRNFWWGSASQSSSTYLRPHTASASPIPVPAGTVVELRAEKSLAGDPVLATVQVGANGQYSAEWTQNDTTAPNLYLKVFMTTKKGDGTRKLFFSGHNDGDYIHHFWTSKTFLASFRLPSVEDTKTYGMIVNLDFGANSDSDAFTDAGKNGQSANPADWPVADLKVIEGDRNLANDGFSTEERYRDIAANLRVLDMAFDAVEARLAAVGKGGIMHYSQEIELPGISGGFANPVTWSIHIGWDTVDTLVPIHEYGHIVMYLSIGGADGLVWEIFQHWTDKESNLSIAFYEGWAECFATTFAAATAGEYRPVANFYAEAYALPNPTYYDHPVWKGDDKNGTDNSGEIVEGAVGRVFYELGGAHTAFTTSLEPVWSIWRDYTSPQIDDFEDFYDKYMAVTSAAATRQAFRTLCETNGIVYSRAKATRVASVAQRDNFVDAQDKVWVSAEGKIKAEQMSASNLKVSAVDETAGKVAFEIWKGAGAATPINWTTVTYSNLVAGTNWTQFADDTSGDGFYGVLNAASAGLANKYYPVRVRVLEDGSASTTTEDKCEGPVLDPQHAWHVNDASGKNTATWWRDIGIMYQLKVDKEKPTVKERKPAAN